MKHTPTPKWTLEEIATRRGLVYIKIKRGKEAHACIGVYGPPINGRVNRVRPASVARARAKEIIEACNAYESLTKGKADPDAAVLVAAKTIEGLEAQKKALLEAVKEARRLNAKDYRLDARKVLDKALALCDGDGE